MHAFDQSIMNQIIAIRQEGANNVCSLNGIFGWVVVNQDGGAGFNCLIIGEWAY